MSRSRPGTGPGESRNPGRDLGARAGRRRTGERILRRAACGRGFAVISPDGMGRRLERLSYGYAGQIDDLARMPELVRARSRGFASTASASTRSERAWVARRRAPRRAPSPTARRRGRDGLRHRPHPPVPPAAGGSVRRGMNRVWGKALRVYTAGGDAGGNRRGTGRGSGGIRAQRVEPGWAISPPPGFSYRSGGRVGQDRLRPEAPVSGSRRCSGGGNPRAGRLLRGYLEALAGDAGRIAAAGRARRARAAAGRVTEGTAEQRSLHAGPGGAVTEANILGDFDADSNRPRLARSPSRPHPGPCFEPGSSLPVAGILAIARRGRRRLPRGWTGSGVVRRPRLCDSRRSPRAGADYGRRRRPGCSARETGRLGERAVRVPGRGPTYDGVRRRLAPLDSRGRPRKTDGGHGVRRPLSRAGAAGRRRRGGHRRPPRGRRKPDHLVMTSTGRG